MNSIEEFLALNKLKQIQLARFLGMDKSSISQAVSGKMKLSQAKINQILMNENGWDVSPLSKGTTMVSAKASSGGSANAIFGNANAIGENWDNKTLRSELAILRKENEMLRERLADKDALLADKAAQIDFLKQLLTKQ